MTEQTGKNEQPTILTSSVLAVRGELADDNAETIHEFSSGAYRVQALRGVNSLWIAVKRGTGGLALRTAYSPGPPLRVETISASKSGGD